MKPLEAALRYLEMNLSVIPVRADKKPLIPWAEFQTRRPSQDEVKEWWKHNPSANVGIVTGEISNLFVVDTDTPESTKEIQDYLPENLITPIQTTPHDGHHFLFSHTEGFSNRARVAPGVDIRTTGGFIVVDPSTSDNGKGWKWMDGLSLSDVTPAPLPGTLLLYLKEYAFKGGYGGGISDSPQNDKISFHKLFAKGTRDEDLFHIAHQLSVSRTPEWEIREVLEILAQNCKPPFPEKELEIKIKSALERSKKRDFNITQDLKAWIESQEGHWKVTEYHNESQIVTKEAKHAVIQALKRFQNEGLIEKYGNQRGIYRRVEGKADDIDFMNVEEKVVEIAYPFEIEKWVLTLPKNIIIVAGEVNAGKTAFLLNTCFLNMGKFKIHYYSSEMGALELRARLKKFECNLEHWKENINFKERSSNFADVIKPNDVNIIDYLEITDEFYKIGGMIKEVFDKLKKGIAIIALQKNPKTDFGLGGMRSVEKARLYVAMERGNIKIVKGKNWASEVNPNGISRSFKLVQGAKFIATNEWIREK